MFDVDDYIASAEAQLDAIESRRRIAFAAWCCDRLLSRSVAWAQCLRYDEVQTLYSILEKIWQYVLGKDFPPDELNSMERWCLGVHVLDCASSVAVSDAEDVLSIIHATLLAMQGGTAREAAVVAEAAFENAHSRAARHYTAGMPTVQDPSDLESMLAATARHPVVLSEIDLQEKQIEFLRSGQPLAANDRFRWV